VKSAVETLNPTRVKLTVEVPFDELKPSLDAAYKSIARQVNIPGFRKGKVPPRIIDQRVGRGVVLEEAVNEALPVFYARAVEESAVRPLGRPQVDVTGVPDPAAGGDLTFTAEVDIRPAITLPPLEAVEVTVEDVDVSDEDVDERLENLRERFGTLSPVDRPVAEGDFVAVDIRADIDGEEIDSVSGVSYQVGSGTMLEGMDDALPGLSAGETTTFDSPLAGGDHAGEEAQVTLTVQSVKERHLPDLDDDFAQLASEFDTLEELRSDLGTQVEAVQRYQQGLQARERLLQTLLDSVEIPVPDGVVADEVARHLESEDRTEDDEHRAEVEEETRAGLRTQFLLDAIGEAENVSVSQRELIEYLVVNAQQYGMDPNEFAQAVEQAGQVPAMVSEVARRKALAAVLSRAVVKDASGNLVDLELSVPGAQDGQDEQTQDAGAEPAGEAGTEGAAQPGAQGAAPSPTAPAAPAVPSAADPTAVPVFDLPPASPAGSEGKGRG
jgi:trigger factor